MDKEKIKFIHDSLGEAEVINRYRKRTMGENS